MANELTSKKLKTNRKPAGPQAKSSTQNKPQKTLKIRKESLVNPVQAAESSLQTQDGDTIIRTQVSSPIPNRIVAEAAPLKIEAQAEPWMELKPSGFMVLPGPARPAFLLKSDTGETLPVWMSPLDSSVVLHELSQGSEGSPQRLTAGLLKLLAIEKIDCFFEDLVGHHQYILLKLTTRDDLVYEIKSRSDEAMSFAIAHRARFYAKKSLIQKCRSLHEDMSKLQEGILSGVAQAAFPELEIGSKKPPYMM